MPEIRQENMGFMYSSLEQRANQSIAHGALTNSKRPTSFVKGVYPTHLDYGKECYVYNGSKRYVDYICGLGTNLIGYGHPYIAEKLKEEINKGFSLSLSSSKEVFFAEKVKAFFPWMERIRILKSGSEGCTAAIRIARTYTKKNIVLSQGYHGWHDEFVSLTPPANGVPYCEHIFSNLLMDFPNIAAIIVEPIITDASQERIKWLTLLKEHCIQKEIVLIFDETITGMRYPDWSVSKSHGIEPDITIMGKALAGGLPISIVGGKKNIMECDYFISSTFAGEQLTITAAHALFDFVNQSDECKRIFMDSNHFVSQFNEISPLISIEGYGTRGVFKAKDELTQALFFQECCKAGILFGPTFFWCLPHAFESQNTLAICRAILRRIEKKEIELTGEMPVKPFSQKVRENVDRS